MGRLEPCEDLRPVAVLVSVEQGDYALEKRRLPMQQENFKVWGSKGYTCHSAHVEVTAQSQLFLKEAGHPPCPGCSLPPL